jgi:hypothetical protein
MIGTCESCKNKKECADDAEMSLETFLMVSKRFNWPDIDCIDYEKEE